jgi:hypothetical protein
MHTRSHIQMQLWRDAAGALKQGKKVDVWLVA